MIDPRHVALLAHRDTEEARAEGSVMPEALGIGTSIDCAAVQAAAPGRPARRSRRAAGRGRRPVLALDRRGRAVERGDAATPVQQPGGLALEELVELAATAGASIRPVPG